MGSDDFAIQVFFSLQRANHPRGRNFDRAARKRRTVQVGEASGRRAHTRRRVDDTTTQATRVQPVVAWGEGEGKVKAKHRRWKLAPCSRIGKRRPVERGTRLRGERKWWIEGGGRGKSGVAPRETSRPSFAPSPRACIANARMFVSRDVRASELAPRAPVTATLSPCTLGNFQFQRIPSSPLASSPDPGNGFV